MLDAELAELAPKGDRRMGAENPHANGGLLLRESLKLPDYRELRRRRFPSSGNIVEGEATRVCGALLRDAMKLNLGQANFRVLDQTRRLESAGCFV